MCRESDYDVHSALQNGRTEMFMLVHNKNNRQNSTLPHVTCDGSRTVHEAHTGYRIPGIRCWLQGSLLASVPSRAFAEANKRGSRRKSRDKRGPYVNLTSSQYCEIVKYADQHGAAETARHFPGNT